MDVFPAENQVGGYDQAEETDGGDSCRICRSPEGPENPLRYPCACRGSIKYVHQECLLLWLDRRGYKQCEVCGRSYSFVPVYSEDAPERLPCHEFLRGLSLRALRVAAWVFVILFNAYCFSLHPWGREAAFENQTVFQKFASLLPGFFYNAFIAYLMTMMALLRPLVEDLFGLYLVKNDDLGRGGGVAFVLFQYMGILCDWWHDHLTRRGFFHAIIDEPPEALVRPRNPRLHDFGAIRRFLDDNAFAALAISFYVSFFFLLLPFVMGRLVIALLLLFQRVGVATQLLSGDSLAQEPVLVGYMTILSLSLVYLGSFATLTRESIQAIAKRLLSLGLLIVAVALPFVLWIFSVKVWKNLYLVKDGFILCLKFGVLPLLLGCWLDFCILPVLGTTVSQRLEFLSNYPFVMITHWTFGLICLILLFNFMELIQKIFQKRPFWFLLDVTDPNYKITKLHVGRLLFALVFHGSLLVILVHLPIMTISFVSPSFFPLQFWVHDTEERIMFLSIAGYIWLTRVRAPEWLTELIKPAIEPIVHKWIISVSSWLQLSEFFLENHANQNVRPLLQQGLEIRDSWLLVISVAEGSLVRFYGSQKDTTFEEDIDDDRLILLRIGLMLVLAALSLFLISTISMALPILVGKAFFHSIFFVTLPLGLKHDDYYGFWIGCYILRVIYMGTCFIYNHIMNDRLASQPCSVVDTECLSVLHLDLRHTNIAWSPYRSYDHHPITSAAKRIPGLFIAPRLVDRISCPSHLDLSNYVHACQLFRNCGVAREARENQKCRNQLASMDVAAWKCHLSDHRHSSNHSRIPFLAGLLSIPIAWILWCSQPSRAAAHMAGVISHHHHKVRRQAHPRFVPLHSPCGIQ